MQLNHVSILGADYRLPYPHKAGAWRCTFGTSSHRCKHIRTIDNAHGKATDIDRPRIHGILDKLLDNPFALGLDDCIGLAEEWVVANLCMYHSGPSVVRAVRNEKLGELGWNKTEIETRSDKMSKETGECSPLDSGALNM